MSWLMELGKRAYLVALRLSIVLLRVRNGMAKRLRRKRP